MVIRAAMTDGPCDFLSTFEDQLTEHRDANRAAHASIAEHIDKKDLPGLMSHATDPHGILALAPDELKPCADAIRGFGDAAFACTAECSAFVKTAEQHLGSLLESCKEGTHGTMAQKHRKNYANQTAAVNRTRMALSALEGKSYSAALRLEKEPKEVDAMDDDEKAQQYEKMQRQLHLKHIEQTQSAVKALVLGSQLPVVHDMVHRRQQEQEALQEKVDLVTSKKDVADKLFAGLEKQQADVLDKMEKCSQIRRVTIRAEETKRKMLEEAEKARQVAWKEYQDAYLRNEAATIMEAKLAEAQERASEELEFARRALAETIARCQQCDAEAVNCFEAVRATIQASHASLLVYSREAVEEAWKNTALGCELSKCLVADKRREYNHLLEEQRHSEEQAAKQKQRTVKAKNLEKVEQLGQQISTVCAELNAMVAGTRRAEDHFNIFRRLNSGLDEEAITLAAQDAASACYGNFQLYLSEDDGSDDSTEASGSTTTTLQMQHPLDKLRIEMEEKHKIEKQQLLAEIQLKFQEREKAFELEKEQLVLMVREEVRAELQREDASSLHSFEPISASDIGE